MGRVRSVLLCVALLFAAVPAPAVAAGADSARMSRAKDLIADEQWRRAIVELRAAYDDPQETAKDEAAFWLAHSLYQSGDAGAALQLVAQLERRFPRSRWVFPARSLMLEIAHRLNRNDLLWSFAVPPPPPPAPPAPVTAPVPRSKIPAEPPVPPGAPAAAPPVSPAVPPAIPVPPGAPAAPAMPAPRPGHRRQWVMDMRLEPELAARNRDLQILALGGLMRAEPNRAEPILKTVALKADNEEQARRAIFVLLQANRLAAVADVAKQGSEEVTLAAIKELGYVRSSASARLLTDLYVAGSQPVKVQVLRSLGRARQARSLMQVAREERERPLRETAVAALGQAGARLQLAALYRQEPDLRGPVISALFTAGAQDELVTIARRERDSRLRADVLNKLKLLGWEP